MFLTVPIKIKSRMLLWNWCAVAMVGVLVYCRAWRVSPTFFGVQVFQLLLTILYEVVNQNATAHPSYETLALRFDTWHLIRQINTPLELVAAVALYRASKAIDDLAGRAYAMLSVAFYTHLLLKTWHGAEQFNDYHFLADAMYFLVANLNRFLIVATALTFYAFYGGNLLPEKTYVNAYE